MFRIIWDRNTNGVICTDATVSIEDSIVPPRPVFFEELDLLGFNSYWDYPKTEAPLLWATGRRYFFKGEPVAETKGGDLFHPPEVTISDKTTGLTLEPVSIPALIERNAALLSSMENEALDFVTNTYKRLRKKIDFSAASFSGGKDSQVVLDLVSRAIPPDEYAAIFNDTGMELPSTYAVVKETEDFYRRVYPNFQFYISSNDRPALELWDKFGPPSRIQRWCCSVCKTAPFARFIRRLLDKDRQPKVLVFEGLRHSESARRSSYGRIGDGVKHLTIINSRPLINWNTTEIFLYLFSRRININPAYRSGLHRVGCSICPFTSEWSDYFIGELYPSLADSYLGILFKHAAEIGVTDQDKVRRYVQEGQWKKRAGGRGIRSGNVRIDFIGKNSHFEAVITNAREDYLEWCKTLGTVQYEVGKEGIRGQIEVRESGNFDFEIQNKNLNNRTVFKVNGIDGQNVFISRLRGVLYKTAYCVNCGVCEVECPTGALQVIPRVKIDRTKCLHCGNCLTFVDKSCLVAKSVAGSAGGSTMANKTSGIDRYSTFGLRKEWLDNFINNPEHWFTENNLGPKQVEAMVNWLKETELLNKSNKSLTDFVTPFQKLFRQIPQCGWAIIFVNLCFNSTILAWYVRNVKWNKLYSKDDLFSLLKNSFPSLSDGTLNNPLTALLNLFDSTPLGNELRIGVIEKEGNKRSIRRFTSEDLDPRVIGYSLYKYAIKRNKFALTISELYDESQEDTPYQLFGVPRTQLENALRYLQELNLGVVRADLAKGLDNIHLNPEIGIINFSKLLADV